MGSESPEVLGKSGTALLVTAFCAWASWLSDACAAVGPHVSNWVNLVPRGQESTCSPSAADKKGLPSAGKRQRVNFPLLLLQCLVKHLTSRHPIPKAVTYLGWSYISGSALSPQEILHSCVEVTECASADVLLIILGAGGTAA